MIYQPYTYLIKFKITEQLYYGVRTKIGCSPDDLWVRYFTSSKVVKNLIAEHGADSFEVVSIKLHSCKEDALKWEELYLVSVDAGYNEEYLNKTNGAKNFTQAGLFGENAAHFGRLHSEESKKKQSKAKIGKYRGENHHLWGKHHSEETKKKMSENHANFSGENHPMFGKQHSEETLIKMRNKKIGKRASKETRKKLSDSRKGSDNSNSKKYIVTFPDGHEEIISCMRIFCIEYNLNSSSMSQIAKDKYKQHKGFKCRYATEQEIIDNQPK
ncbi:MAG: NUMOD3 domain-containing DNA-binding protein [Bacilli bacterium]|nr:NUMOD3 domain-containing DNA-binding protein [Bacilli bacterium]